MRWAFILEVNRTILCYRDFAVSVAMDNSEPERKPPSFGVRKLVFAIILAVIFLLLGQAMVRHRFFRGGRITRYGSLTVIQRGFKDDWLVQFSAQAY